jgi:hypothetical protein
MTLQPTITLAIVPPSAAFYSISDLRKNPDVRKVLFYLQNVSHDKTRVFYECGFDGCLGCGCPSFEVNPDLSIPDWVLDHLRIHVRYQHSPIAGEN